MKDKQRLPGYYWIKFNGNWFVARCGASTVWPNAWHIPGKKFAYTDIEFEEIDERRIERLP